VLTEAEVRAEVAVLAGRIGHKRLIVVYGEHPSSDADFIAQTMRTVYDVKVPVRRGMGQIRRVNVNAAPMAIEDLRRIKAAGLGTYQVFQETYHHGAYARLHPAGTPKSDYAWRITSMHRALEAGIDDVGIGALFGLHDWRFEVMGLVRHALELERRFGIGPHTVSFPRLEPAQNAPAAAAAGATAVSDSDFRRAVVVLRLAVPYTGMILTARETAAMRRALIPLGITQTDASTRIGLGAYSEMDDAQAESRQQFLLGDTRSLDEVIRDLAAMGMITSFCTAGYRCGRTGDKIMGLLKSGKEGHFCKLNAVLTFREWLDDFGSEATRRVGEALIAREIDEIKQRLPGLSTTFLDYYLRVSAGERDLYI
jgi:2-iminoacetate synthase